MNGIKNELDYAKVVKRIEEMKSEVNTEVPTNDYYFEELDELENWVLNYKSTHRKDNMSLN
ncbi:MAG: hypothetical protein KBG80_09685 [Breznakibacter sp.]|nr:hypothetical protein [Breznakibacter sp.]